MLQERPFIVDEDPSQVEIVVDADTKKLIYDEWMERIRGYNIYLNKPGLNCLHLNCPNCRGTGMSSMGGACIHMVSCSCGRCSSTIMC